MTLFDYTAVLRNGTRVSGREAALSADDLIARLQQRHASPLRVREATPRQRSWIGRWPGLGRGGQRDAVVTTAELCTLIGAGLTVDRALTIALDRTATRGLRETLTRVRDSVRGGMSLADALEAETATFSRIYVALVRAGEMSGDLGQTLGRLHTYLSNRDALRHQLRSALVYPAALIVTAMGSLLVLCNFVLPQFVPMFAEAGKPLPRATRILLAVNHFLASSWPLLLGLAFVAAFAISRVLSNEDAKVRLHGAMLPVPVLGDLWRSIDAARLARTASALLQSGVAVPAALGLSLQVVTNAAIRKGVSSALGGIRAGASVSQALQKANILPDLSIQLLAIGEETGRLDQMFLKQAEMLEDTSARRISVLLALLVPGLTIGIGLIVGSVMAAVMLAVLQLNDLVG